MNRLVVFRVGRGFVLAMVLGVGLTWIGCDGQLGKRPGADRPLAGVDNAESSAMASEDAANRKRYCSVYLLNTALEEPEAAKNEAKKPTERPRDDRIPEAVRKYKQLHDEIPPEVLKAMAAHNLRNYSVFIGLVSGDYHVVRYFEHVGENAEVDLTLLAREPAYRQWQEACDACQVVLLPVSGTTLGPFMEEIFHNPLRPSPVAKQLPPAEKSASEKPSSEKPAAEKKDNH